MYQQPPQETKQPGTFGASSARPKQQRSLKRWWRLQSRPVKVGITFLAIPVILFSLFLCSAAGSGAYQALANPTQTTPVPTTAAKTAQPAQIATTPTQAAPTPTPMPQPTMAPMPQPTPMPQPAQVPMLRPAPTPRPQPTPTPKPAPMLTPTPTVVTGVNGNPFGYDFNPTGGQLIFNPPANFCTVGSFKCIKNFNNGAGYVVKCNDGQFAKTGGQAMSCTGHGGDKQPLYSHQMGG